MGDLKDVALRIEDACDRDDVIAALGFRQSSRDPLTVEEVAHDPVGGRPIVVTGDAVMVRAQPDVVRGLESTRGTRAHEVQVSPRAPGSLLDVGPRLSRSEDARRAADAIGAVEDTVRA